MAGYASGLGAPGMTTPPEGNVNLPQPDPNVPQSTHPSVLLGQQPTPVPAPAPPSPGDMSKHLVGKAFGHIISGLSGTENSYSIDPTTGKTVVSTTKAPPGQWAKGVLAAGLLGTQDIGPEHGEHTFAQGLLSGLAGGTRAGMQQREQLDEQKRAQAQADYANQLKAAENQREQKKLNMQEDLNKASIAAYTAQTVGETYRNLLSHQANQHAGVQATVERDAPIKKIMDDAGEEIATGVDGKPLTALTGAEFQKLLADNQSYINAHTVIPVVTGYDPVTHADGSITWEPIGTLYKPTKTVGPELLAQLKAAGIKEDDVLYKDAEQYAGNASKGISPKPIEPTKLITFFNQIKSRQDQQKNNLDIAIRNAELAARNSEDVRNKAQAFAAYQEALGRKLDNQDKISFDNGRHLASQFGTPGEDGKPIGLNPDGTYNLNTVFKDSKGKQRKLNDQDKEDLSIFVSANYDVADKRVNKLTLDLKNNPGDQEIKDSLKEETALLSIYTHQLNAINGTNLYPGAKNPASQVYNILNSSVEGLDDATSAAVRKIALSGIPQSEAFRSLGGIRLDPDNQANADKKAAALKALTSFFTNAKPVLNAGKTSLDQVNDLIQKSENSAYYEENPDQDVTSAYYSPYRGLGPNLALPPKP